MHLSASKVKMHFETNENSVKVRQAGTRYGSPHRSMPGAIW